MLVLAIMQTKSHASHGALTPTAVSVFGKSIQKQSIRFSIEPQRCLGTLQLSCDPRDRLHARGKVKVLVQFVAHMSQLPQRGTIEPPGLVKILRRQGGTTVQSPLPHASEPACVGNHQKIRTKPTRIVVRLGARIQEGLASLQSMRCASSLRCAMGRHRSALCDRALRLRSSNCCRCSSRS